MMGWPRECVTPESKFHYVDFFRKKYNYKLSACEIEQWHNVRTLRHQNRKAFLDSAWLMANCNLIK